MTRKNGINFNAMVILNKETYILIAYALLREHPLVVGKRMNSHVHVLDYIFNTYILSGPLIIHSRQRRKTE